MDDGREAADRRADAVVDAIGSDESSSAWVNANQIFYWRKLLRAGQLRNGGGAEPQVRQLPVTVGDEQPAETVP